MITGVLFSEIRNNAEIVRSPLEMRQVTYCVIRISVVITQCEEI